MTLSKDEFKVMVMLYAANIDGNIQSEEVGNIQSEEVKVMLKKTDFETVDKVESMFDKMNDAEVIECIRENKPLYVTSESDRLEILADLCAIIEADENCTVMEEYMVGALRRILE